MISLYIHIPFCHKKCNYCNFFVIPLNISDSNSVHTISNNCVKITNIEALMSDYLKALETEIVYRSQLLKHEQIKTIYIWWWTPLAIWSDNILYIISLLKNFFDLTFLEELSIELNPDPINEVLDFVSKVNDKYKNLFRIRYSFGVQSLDDNILKHSNRWYIYNQLIWFLRRLVPLKVWNNVFNFDFIAFGKFNHDKSWNKLLWDNNKMEFFQNFLNSGFADWFSLYMLELFAWSLWYGKDKRLVDPQDDIYEEFEILRQMIQDAWYNRYEISNFALSWWSSIHNRVYWQMWNYVGLWMWASSYLDSLSFKSIFNDNPNTKFNLKHKIWIEWLVNDIVWVRFSNTKSWKQYFDWKYVDESSIILLSQKDYDIEKFFLGMRTTDWIDNISWFKWVLVNDYKDKIAYYQDQWSLRYYVKNDKIVLTDFGMDIYNTIITELIKEF